MDCAPFPPPPSATDRSWGESTSSLAARSRSFRNPDDGQFLIAVAAIAIEMAVVGDDFERRKQFAGAHEGRVRKVHFRRGFFLLHVQRKTVVANDFGGDFDVPDQMTGFGECRRRRPQTFAVLLEEILRPRAALGRFGERADDKAGVSEKHGSGRWRRGFSRARFCRATPAK